MGRSSRSSARRDGSQFDLYRVPVDGGVEQRLTTHAAHDDGTDYSRDGAWIYFNSERSGGNDIWRMPHDGAGRNDARAERVTSDDWEDWFPHPSPDGKWLIFRLVPPGHQRAQRSYVAGAVAPAPAPRRQDDARHARNARHVHRGPGHDQRQLVVAGRQGLRVRDVRRGEVNAPDGGALLDVLGART